MIWNCFLRCRTLEFELINDRGEQNEEASPTLDPKPVVDDSTSLEELSRPYAHLQKKEMKAPVGSSTGTGELEESIESSRFH